MKRLLILFSFILTLTASAEVTSRLVLHPEESRAMEISEISGLGLVAYLGGDSIILLDSPDLEIAHLPAMNDARQILNTGSALYCSIGNYVCSLDTVNMSLNDVMIVDNEDFKLYPAIGDSFFVLTSDPEWSNCILVDPENNIYSDVLEFPGLIKKVVASRDHCFVWIEDNICLVGQEGQLATLLCEPTLTDLVLTPSGIVVATSDGLWVIEDPSHIHRISDEKIEKLWYVDKSLYLMHENGMLIALDNFEYK